MDPTFLRTTISQPSDTAQPDTFHPGSTDADADADDDAGLALGSPTDVFTSVAVSMGLPSKSDTPATRRPPRNGKRYLVLVYMRVSHDLQEGNYTFETQWERTKERLDRYYGEGNYDTEIYKDNGLSGRYGPRKTGIQKQTRNNTSIMEEKLLGGAYDALACYKMNRLFRSTRWITTWVEDVFIPSDIDFISATEDIDIRSPQGRAMLKMVATMDEYWSEGGGERVADAHATRNEQGFPSGPPPYGWEYVPAEKVPKGARRGIQRNESQIVHLQHMMEKVLAGWSTPKIALDLTKRGVPTPKGGTEWYDSHIRNMVLNEIHAGYVHSKRKGRIKGQHFEQRICDLETIEEIRRTLELRRRCGKSNVHKADQPHLLNGVASCPRCDRHLYVYTGNSASRYYRCPRVRRSDGGACRDVTVRADWIEDAVLRNIELLSENPEMRRLVREEAARLTGKEHDQVRKRRQQIEGKLQALLKEKEGLIAAVARNVLSDEDFKIGSERLRKDESALREELLEAEQSAQRQEEQERLAHLVQEKLHDFPLVWSHLNLDERRHLLRLLIDELYVDRDGRDAVIKLKLHLLPEVEERIAFESMRQMKERPKGPQALTRRELAFLHHFGQGLNPREAAAAMGVPVTSIYTFRMKVRRTLGTEDLNSCYQLARQRIESLLPNLPLGPTTLCKVHGSEREAGAAPELTPALMEVFPLLAQGASIPKVVKLTALSYSAVKNRRDRICDIFRVDDIFDAGQRARELNLL